MSSDSLGKIDISPVASISNIDDLEINVDSIDSTQESPIRQKSMDIISINSMDLEIKALKNSHHNNVNASTMSIYARSEVPDKGIESRKVSEFAPVNEEYEDKKAEKQLAEQSEEGKSQIHTKGNSDTLQESANESSLEGANSKSTLDISTRQANYAVSRSKSNLELSSSKPKLAPTGSKSNLVSPGSKAELAFTGSKANLASTGSKVNLSSTGSKVNLATTGSKANLVSAGSKPNLAASKPNLATSGSKPNLATSGSKQNLATSGSKPNLATSGSKHNLAASKQNLTSTGSKPNLAASKTNLADSTGKSLPSSASPLNDESQTPASHLDLYSSAVTAMPQSPTLQQDTNNRDSQQQVIITESPSENVLFEKSVTNSPPQIKLMEASTLSLNHILQQENQTDELPFEAGNILIAITDYHAQDLDELGLKFGDVIELDITPKEDELYWLKGTIQSNDIRNGQQGFFPKAAVEHYDPNKTYEPPEPKNESPADDIGLVEPVPRGTTVVALYDYEQTKQDELTFTTGTSIIVMECPEGGWWKGVTGMEEKKPVTGWFPANLVKVKEKNSAITSHERPKSAEPPKSATLELPNQDNRKVSWFRRLRSSNDSGPEEHTNIRRNRSTSAPPNKNEIIYSDEQLNGSKESSEMFPPSVPQTPTHSSTPSHTQEDFIRRRTESIVRSPQTNSTAYEIKPIGDDETFLSSGGRNSRTSIMIAKGEEGSIVSRSRAESSNRGTIFIAGQLSPAEIFQGAIDQKVQDLIPPSVYKFLSDKEKQRLSVVWELIQTERDYVRDLAIIVEMFMKPMQNLPSMLPKNMQMLFANVEQILSVNSDFLYLLTQIEDIRNINAYAEVFLTMGERFMCYIPYCSNQQATSAKFIKSLLSKGEIKSFLEEVYRNPMIRQLDLPGFLLKPIQRICKYPLLIREMIKNTPPDHSDLISINKAMERMQNCVATINECARKLNGMKPMLEVQNRFSEKINIVSSNRFLVREDTIQVMFSDSKKTRKMFMFNDMLILARKDWRDKHHVIEKTALKDIRVSDISETSGGQGVGSTLLLEIEILATSEYDQPNRYIIALASIQEKQTWLDAYKSLVRYIVKSKNINDITMTSSSADAAGEDDDNERVLHHRESFMEDDSTRAKKFDSSQYDSQIAELNAKVEALEKMIADKDGKIKEWETRVVKFEEDGKAEVEKLKNAISSKDEELKASTLLNGQLTTQVESFKMQTQQLQTRLEASEQEQENLSKSKAASAQEYVKEIQYLTKLLKDQEELTEKQILQTKRQEEITLRQEEETVLKQRTIIELNGKLNDLYDSMDEKEKAFKKADEKSKATIKQLQADLQDVTENLTKKQNALELVIEAVDMAVAQLAPMKRNMSSFGLVKRGVLSPSISKVRTEYRKASIVNDEFGSLQSLIDELNRTVQSSLQLRDENLQLIEDQSNNISQLSEQVNALKGKLMEKESNINNTSHQSTMLQKKIAELEQLLNDSRSQIASLKKIQSDLENLTEEQKVQNRKTITENELVVIELKSQLKLESDNTKALSQKLKLLETDLSSKDVQIKDQSAVIQSQAFKIQNMSGDVNEKDTNLKQISDRASSLQHLVDEIQNVVHIAQTDSMVTFPHHGGLLMQIKAFIESANTTVADLQKKCGELEHGLNNLKTLGAQKQEDFAKLELQLQTKTSELTELTIQFSKTKEKLAQCKTELSDAKEEIESMKMLLSQQKQNLEQARGTIEHMKITASSTDRQQKQTQAALEEARKECIAAHDRIKQQQAILQKNSESISELERKFEEQLADIHEKDTYAENLSRKIKEKESEIEELRSTVSLLQNKLSNREINIKELENKLAQIQKDFEEKSLEQGKVIKQLKIEVNDLQELHNSYKQQSGVDKERFKYDFERDVTNLKAKISDTETLLSSAHQKIQQKEYKCNELEQAVKDLKFKLSEQELSIANLQSKISSKDAKLLELESNNMNFISNNNSLKQKLSESESRILDIQSKLNEVESRNQKMEINLSASSANNSSQEQRIQELKSQIEDYTEQVKKLEREKKDLESQMEQLNYTLTSLNKEHRSLKESMEDSQSKLSKAETQAKLFAKDAQRDLEAMEEKYKLLMERERSDKALELASVKHELESLRKSATDEKLKLKQDFESNMAERIKSHQNEIEMLSKKFDFQLDELTQQLSRAKVDSKEKTEELKQQQQIEINQLKAKAEAASDSSRKTISELQENIHFSEKQISKLEESLKFKEIEAVKVALELEKAQDEIKKLKLSTISFEEGSYAKIKSLERDLEEKNINLAKRQEEIEEMNEKLEKTLAQQEALTADLVKERELSAQYSKKVEEAGFKISQTEAKYFSEISLLKSEKQDVEIKFHDHLLTIERMKTIEESHKEMIRKLVSDIELNKELLSKKEGEIDAIKEEKHKLQSSIKDHEHTVDKKTKDIETFGVQLRDLQETLKVRQEKIYTLTLENDQISAQNKQLIQEIENLEEELSDSKKNLKKADEHHKEELKKTAKESKKKYQIEMEELTSKLTAEKMSVLEKQELEFKSKMQRLVDEFEAYKTSASNDLTAAKTRSQLDEESRKELLEKINILEEEVGENNLREDNLVSELEDKVKQILQLKKRYKGSEEEHNNLLDQLRRLEQVNKDTADQLTEMYDKNIELQMQKQQVSLELEYSQKQIAQLQDYSTKYAEAQKTLQDLNNALADKKKELQDIETQNEALKKMVVKQTKSIASIQITLSEIGSLLEIQMPWSSEDIIALPEKMKNAFKAGKLRQIESIDTSLLLNVVTTVKDLVNEWKELKKSTVNQTHTIQDYQLMQNHAESQLKEASIAMEVIEARLRNQELQYGKEKLELKRKQEVLERSLDEALYKLDVSTKKSKILEENIEALKKEKQELEKDFIQLYERLQTSKNEFSQQTQLIYQDSSALIQQNESLKFQLSRHKEQLKSLSDQLSETSKEKAFANEMYQKTEMLLKEANENILRLTDRISSLQKEVQFSSKERDLSNSKIKNLQKDIDDLVIANNELQVSKAQSIRALEMELEKELKQIQTLSTTILESNYLLEDYKKYKAKYENLSNQYKKLENEKDGLEHQLQKQTVDLNNLQSEKEIQKEKNAELQHIYDSIKKEKEGLVHELQSVKYKKSPLDQIRNLSRNSSYSSSVDDRKLLDPRTTLDLKLSRNSSVVDKDDRKPLEPRIPFDLTHSRTSSYAESKLLDPRIVIDDNI